MVAPIKVTVPSSTNGRTVSCCDLLKRWISSMNRIVLLRYSWRRSLASSIICLSSATPALVALTELKWESVMLAMMYARVVLPLPGGPQRIMEGSWSASIALLRVRPSPTRCSWPTNSLKLTGRMRAASGASLPFLFSISCSKMSISRSYTAPRC